MKKIISLILAIAMIATLALTFVACNNNDDNANDDSSKTSLKIGVQTGTTGQYFVDGDEDWGFAGYGVTTVGYKAGSLAVQDMINGNLSFVVIDEAPAKCIVREMNG